MLTYDTLIEEATLRDMPPGKPRGILREYLQVLILREIYRLPSGRKLYFTGGTYLRLVHQTKRFSEDLDFNTDKMTGTEFENVLHKVKTALEKEGLGVKLEFEHWGHLFVGALVFPEVEKNYGVISANARKEGIVIKVETHQPVWTIKTETLVVTGFGHMYPVICTERGALFADKIDALVKKNRARHLFDILLLLSQKAPVDTQVLNTLGIQEPPFEVVLKRINSFSAQELKKQAESLRPFLFDESEAELLVNAPAIAKQLIERYS
jgi:predicted nucleotidyltransferase component of viral defense system